MIADNIELIQSLIESLTTLKYDDDGKLDEIRRRSKLIVGKIFGQNSNYIKELESIRFYPSFGVVGAVNEPYQIEAWESGHKKLANFFNILIEDLILSAPANKSAALTPEKINVATNKVFVVHGHDAEMKQTVARVLEIIGLEPIILHEQADGGRTVIEKFLEHATGASFAVVLLSPDDMAYQTGGSTKTARPRARQNVILELGFFIAKLGRERVFVLYRETKDFEFPSDYSGVIYKPYDGDSGRWQYDLVKELKVGGYTVDANKLY